MGEIVELEPGDLRVGAAAEVMRELRTHLDAGEIAARFERQHAEGYRLAAAFDGEECVAVAGYRLLENLASGRFLYIDDLVTAGHRCSQRFGERLDEYLAGVARAGGCESVQLDSGVQRTEAHRFYERRGYSIVSHHFARRVER